MDYREIDRLKKNPRAFRDLARLLVRMPDAAWTEWELDFLDSVSERELEPAPSTRQCEVLLELRENVTNYTQVEGLSVRAMIAGAWQARADLEEDDEQFVAALQASGATAVKRRALRRLIGCARRLGLLESQIRL